MIHCRHCLVWHHITMPCQAVARARARGTVPEQDQIAADRLEAENIDLYVRHPFRHAT